MERGVYGSVEEFSVSPGYDALTDRQAYAESPYEGLSFAPNPAYESYLRMHKVFVGQAGGEQLEQVHQNLRGESLPRYLDVAGWAAAEAALVDAERPATQRVDMINQAVGCWRRALGMQQQLNVHAPAYMAEYAVPHRMALNIAVAPLLKGIVVGNVTEAICEQVFLDCLNIAQSNVVQLKLMSKENHIDGIAEHIGFGYECNALLALNRFTSPTWFAIPSMARSDSGHHYREQTHDLLLIRQKWGHIKSVIPVEVKAKASLRDRERYKALLVRGKMHLSVPGKCTPRDTLDALAAVHQGTATKQEAALLENVSGRFMDMISDYYAGKRLGRVATQRTVTLFRDNGFVVANHPGLGTDRPAAAAA
jgi:hypothetical protein